MANQYHRDIDFAFFFVNFGISKADYLELTKRERMFIYKAWEDKTVRESTFLRNAVFNAVSNAMRSKNKRFVELWKKVQRPLDKEKAQEDLTAILETEKREGKSWIDAIYYVNGLKKPEGSDR